MFKDLVKQNRSYRRYDADISIPDELLENLVDLARLTPSAANLQPLRYMLITDPILCERIFPHIRWAGYLRYWEGPEISERPSAYILILSPVSSTKYVQIDTGIAAQTILLGATEAGYGGCMIASMDKEAIQSALSIPLEYETILCIALGKPAEEIIIEEMDDPDDVEYYRDHEGIHHVPKRKLKDILF